MTWLCQINLTWGYGLVGARFLSVGSVSWKSRSFQTEIWILFSFSCFSRTRPTVVCIAGRGLPRDESSSGYGSGHAGIDTGRLCYVSALGPTAWRCRLRAASTDRTRVWVASRACCEAAESTELGSFDQVCSQVISLNVRNDILHLDNRDLDDPLP